MDYWAVALRNVCGRAEEDSCTTPSSGPRVVANPVSAYRVGIFAKNTPNDGEWLHRHVLGTHGLVLVVRILDLADSGVSCLVPTKHKADRSAETLNRLSLPARDLQSRSDIYLLGDSGIRDSRELFFRALR